MNHKPQETGSSNLSIFSVFRKWLDTHLADEEAILMVILIATGLWIVVTLDYVFAPLITSLIFAYLLQGLVVRLQRLGLGHLPAVIVVFTGFVLVSVAVLWIMLPLMWEQLRILATELPRMANKAHHVILDLPVKYPELISQIQFDLLLHQLAPKIAAFGEAILSYSIASVPGVLALMGYAILVPLLVFFLLKDKDQLMASIERLLPRHRPVMIQVWQEMNEQIANYVRGKVIQILIVMAATTALFQWMGLHYSILLGILVGFSVIIPYVGLVMVTIPVTLVAYLQWGFTPDFFWLMIAYLLVQAVDGSIVVPILFSEAVALHPVVIIMSVLLFGGLWGFWGVFFAIPLATLIKAVMRAWPSADNTLFHR